MAEISGEKLVMSNEKIKIGVVTAWDDNGRAIAEATLPNRRDYCARHGYGLEAHHWPGRRGHWLKAAALLEALPKYDWLMWLDTDALFMALDRRINATIMELGNLVFTADYWGLQTGVFFLEKCDWSLRLLKEWAASEGFFHGFPNAEQTALAYLLYRHDPIHWQCVAQRSFNSYLPLYGHDYPPEEYQPGDFILHLPGLADERRLQLIHQLLAGTYPFPTLPPG